jgi:hypothetical protein
MCIKPLGDYFRCLRSDSNVLRNVKILVVASTDEGSLHQQSVRRHEERRRVMVSSDQTAASAALLTMHAACR